MDYSLLLGIYTHDMDACVNDKQRMNLSVSDLLKQSFASDISSSSQTAENDLGSHRRPSFSKQSSGTGLSHKTTTSLKASLLGELDDMIQSVSGESYASKTQFDHAASISEISSRSEKILNKLSYNAVKKTFIEKYGNVVFQECKHDVQAALEELSFRQDRIQPFWSRTRGGMKAFLLQEEVVEMNQRGKTAPRLKRPFSASKYGCQIYKQIVFNKYEENGAGKSRLDKKCSPT